MKYLLLLAALAGCAGKSKGQTMWIVLEDKHLIPHISADSACRSKRGVGLVYRIGMKVDGRITSLWTECFTCKKIQSPKTNKPGILNFGDDKYFAKASNCDAGIIVNRL